MVIWHYSVKDHSNNEREHFLPPLHGYSFQLAAGDLLHADMTVHTEAFVMPVVEQ